MDEFEKWLSNCVDQPLLASHPKQLYRDGFYDGSLETIKGIRDKYRSMTCKMECKGYFVLCSACGHDSGIEAYTCSYCPHCGRKVEMQ